MNTYPEKMGPSHEKETFQVRASIPVHQALGLLLKDPWRNLVLRWNAKAALLSAFFRAAIFLVASLKSHHAGRFDGALAEAIWGALCAGFFGAVTQSMRFAKPKWVSELLVAGVFPILFQTGDFFLHSALGTRAFRAGMIASTVFTALSAAFNLFVMRRGTLLVGAEGSALTKDLASLPRLAVLFVVSGVLRVSRMVVSVFTGGATRGPIASS
jgi:hypothetical protein